jgi:hypothetical protein
MKLKNMNSSYFGTKSSTLEAFGLIAPFTAYPAELIEKKKKKLYCKLTTQV